MPQQTCEGVFWQVTSQDFSIKYGQKKLTRFCPFHKSHSSWVAGDGHQVLEGLMLEAAEAEGTSLEDKEFLTDMFLDSELTPQGVQYLGI